ncbi:MAG: family 43 glycosylhydrolase, partial [Thermoguttaceae bacterium]|nr:family 43 glycosylhydrolase [Thermoguttaceae bacterium]
MKRRDLLAAIPTFAALLPCGGFNALFADEPEKQEGQKRLPPTRLRRGADPWVIEYKGKYYWSQSNNPRSQICVWESDTLDNPGERRSVWQAPARGPYSRELWAPEIHFVDGRFYILFAADDGQNKNHLSYALVSETDDPFSKYELTGPFYTGDSPDLKTENRWAIDSTLFFYRGKRYLIWSGWEDDRDVQFLYIAPLRDDEMQTAAPRVRICANDDYLWERVEER